MAPPRPLHMVAAGLLLTLSGCTAGGSDEPLSATPPASATPPVSAAPSSSADRSTVEPVEGSGSGMVLAGPGTESPTQMVADGAGAVWIRGAWNLTRLDPGTGEATTWDASDLDLLAASKLALASSQRSGVWLFLGARARLFDGHSFVLDLEVPERLLAADRAPGATTNVADVAEVGTDVWLSLSDEADDSDAEEPVLGGLVVRWSKGEWTAMSRRGEGVAGLLATDTAGGVWAAGDVREGDADAAGPSVRRWDGATWTSRSPRLAVGDFLLPVEVVADPTKGVWFLCSACAPGVADTGLLRFDGEAWNAVAAGAVAGLVSDPGYGSLGGGEDYSGRSGWVTVSPDGAAWLASEYGVLRLSTDGGVQRFGAEQGIDYPTDDYSNPIQGIVATSKGAVLILDSLGVLRLEGDRFTRIRAAQLPDFPATDEHWRGNLVAVSQQEAWLVEAGWTEGDWWQRLLHYQDGTWRRVGPDTDYASVCLPVLASDGAVWTTRTEGLVRVSGDSLRVVGKGVTACPELGGPDGSVWVVEGSASADGGDDRVVQIQVDGTRTVAGRPKGFQVVCFLAAGANGSAWVSGGTYDIDDEANRCPGEGEESSSYPGDELARWNGRRWIPVDAPAGFTGMTVSGDTTWAAGGADEDYSGRLDWYRFEKGAWRKAANDTVPPPFEDEEETTWPVLPAPGGGACAQSVEDLGYVLACVQGSGGTAHVGFPAAVSPNGVEQLSVGKDGSVWVVGPQVARLAQSVPTDG